MVTLNAGCGNDFWGTCRIDIDLNAKAKTQTMNICKMDFNDKTFSVTKCISVLEHIKDWNEAIKELCRVTEHVLIIEVPVNSNIWITDIFRILLPTPKNIKLFLNIPKRAKGTNHRFDPCELSKEICKHGFKVEWSKVYQWFHSYPSRCYRFKCERVKL